jgi:hypothetical protein
MPLCGIHDRGIRSYCQLMIMTVRRVDQPGGPPLLLCYRTRGLVLLGVKAYLVADPMGPRAACDNARGHRCHLASEIRRCRYRLRLCRYRHWLPQTSPRILSLKRVALKPAGSCREIGAQTQRGSRTILLRQDSKKSNPYLQHFAELQ